LNKLDHVDHMTYKVVSYRNIDDSERDMNILEKGGWTVYCTSYDSSKGLFIVTYHQKSD